ncbi:hypothetical protein ColLi_02558 [Colletotrichum liriopes]|uniref:Uncharacterized protein n=1 Tax=Colletotrichum liriopes TaxID=708192 RepID=A0AA37LNY4_9PEZI|nr:hypothetical protein ColLi_02558 [Colletotrichum liriopes]
MTLSLFFRNLPEIGPTRDGLTGGVFKVSSVKLLISVSQMGFCLLNSYPDCVGATFGDSYYIMPQE